MKTSLSLQLCFPLAVLGVFPSAAQDAVTNFDAAAGAISPPFLIKNGCISQPGQTVLTNSGRAVYTFTVASAGDYIVLGEVQAPDEASNSFYVNVDGEPIHPGMLWDIPACTNFCTKYVGWRGNGTPEKSQYPTNFFKLTSGVHQLVIRGNEPNTTLKKLSIVKRLDPPAGIRPSPPTGLRVVGSQ